MAEINKEDYYAKINELEEKFTKERSEISTFIKDNILNKLSNINDVPMIQVHAASQRQRLTDKISTLRAKIRKHEEKIYTDRKTLFHNYKTTYNIRLNDTEISKHIEADLEARNNFTQVIENQIDFYKRTIEGIDKIGFSIKYLIEHYKFMSGD